LEIVEELHGRGATIITSQIFIDRWHDIIGEPTIADAILDRIVHNVLEPEVNLQPLARGKVGPPVQPSIVGPKFLWRAA